MTARVAVPLVVGLLCLVVGCGSAAQPSASAAPTPTPTPSAIPAATAAATPTPAPDSLSVTVVASGLGAYLETTIPVAVVRNTATAHAAQGVTVHFAVTTAGGTPVQAVDAHVIQVLPGETLGVAARLDLQGTGDRVAVSVTAVSAWPAGAPGPDPRVAATLKCRTGSCAGFADVLGTLPVALRGMPVTATAVCRSASGAIVGGDASTFDPTPADGAIDVEVILSSAPASCELYATAGV